MVVLDYIIRNTGRWDDSEKPYAHAHNTIQQRKKTSINSIADRGNDNWLIKYEQADVADDSQLFSQANRRKDVGGQEERQFDGQNEGGKEVCVKNTTLS